MKTLLRILTISILTSSLQADDTEEYYSSLPSLGVEIDEISSTLDKLMVRCSKDYRHPHLRQWTLGRQVNTSLYLSHDKKGDVKLASLHFYFGYDKQREKHFQQCLPVARWLINTFMHEHDMTTSEIETRLKEVEKNKEVATYREKDRVMYFRYKLYTVSEKWPEEKDGYRCFRIEIGGPNTQPSTDK